MSANQATERVARRVERGARAGGYVISELGRGDESRWDAFVRVAPDGTFYHLSGWRRIIEDRLHHRSHFLTCERDGKLCAVLPLVHVRSLFGNMLISMPFLVYGGPVATTPEAAAAVVERARELAHELGVDHLELRNRQPLHESIDDGSWRTSHSHVTFRKAIEPEPDANLKAIPRKQRAMIRKGINAGLGYEMDDDATRLHAAMLECKRNLGTPFFDRRYLQAIKDTFTDEVEILTVVRGRDTVASVMSFRHRNEILPYYGGGGVQARDLKGNDFMYWCVMEKACREGVKVFDYGRSMVGSGAYRFKKHWGFEPEPLACQRHLVRAEDVPDVSPANPRFRLAIAAWQRLPLPVAGFLGPYLARRLP